MEYTENRKVKNSRQARAMAKGTRFGRQAREAAWQSAEEDALCRLAAADVRVPRPSTTWTGPRSTPCTGQAGKPWFLDQAESHSRHDAMEQALRACTLWLWLDLRFPGAYEHSDEVPALRGQLNDGMERQLKGKRPLAQMRQRQRRRG